VLARVGSEDGVVAREEHLREAGRADAVGSYAVQDDDGFAIGIWRLDEPGLQDCAVGGGDGDVFDMGVELLLEAGDVG
jgi:hypothetical protein